MLRSELQLEEEEEHVNAVHTLIFAQVQVSICGWIALEALVIDPCPLFISYNLFKKYSR